MEGNNCSCSFHLDAAPPGPFTQAGLFSQDILNIADKTNMGRLWEGPPPIQTKPRWKPESLRQRGLFI